MNPYATTPSSDLNGGLVLAGLVIGFFGWVVASMVVIAVAGEDSQTGDWQPTIPVVILVLLFVAAIGLIVWRRTRRLGQGIVLGIAIGLVVAGGLCIPLMVGTP